MEKVRAYRKIGVALLFVWIIAWAVLIGLFARIEGFRHPLVNMVFTALVNFAFNPCLLIGAMLLDSNAKTPLRKPALIRFSAFYVILCIPVFVFVFVR